MNEYISMEYVAYVVSELLLEKGLINKATFKEIKKRLNTNNSHISQNASA